MITEKGSKLISFLCHLRSAAQFVILFWFVHLCFFTPVTWAQASQSGQTSIVDLDRREGFGPVNTYISAYSESGKKLSLEDVRMTSIVEKFEPIKTRVPDFGYFNQGIWLRLKIRNRDTVSSEQLLHMHTNFMSNIDVYFVHNSKVEHVLHQSETSTFSSRPIEYHQIVAPLEIPPESQGEIFIRYRSEGSTNMAISIETPVSFAKTTNRRVTIDFVFYGIMMVFVVASLLGRLFWRNPTFIAYAFYAASVLIYIFQRDGYAFQYLWPNAPAWNNISSLPLGASLLLFAAFFTRAYLNSNKLHPIIDKLLIGIVIMQLSVVASALIIGESGAKQLAIMTTMIGIIIYFGIGIAAYLKYGRRTLFFVIGWLGILIASVSMTLIHWARVEILGAESIDLMRVAMVFDSFMLGLASVVSVVEIQKDREKLVYQQMDTLNTNLDLHKRLGRAEQKYSLMQSLAERANQRVENTKHDLRQPLFALRSALSELSSSSESAEGREDIEESLTYIEGLVETELEEAMEQGEVPTPREEDGAEILEVEKIFSSLLTMFRADAENKSIELNAISSSQKVHAAPFVILRILSNFISNSIRYAPGARITIGARRRGDKLSLEVHDTGPGMDEDELKSAKERYQRGDNTETADAGMGLGLSIVETLVTENKLEWEISSRKNRGTIAKLLVPVVDE